LHNNQYYSFVKGQALGKRMAKPLWDDWQNFVQWANLNKDMLHGVCVFLAIRGLGKAKAFTKILSTDDVSPENVIAHLIEEAPAMVPSVGNLTLQMQWLLKDAFELHSYFNLAQMLQAENTPAQVLKLQQYLVGRSDNLLQFYLVGVVGVMCGLRGVESANGSLFMDRTNGRNVLAGIRCLERLSDASPHAIYWSYIAERSRWLGLQLHNLEQCALARFACLSRATLDVWPNLLKSWRTLRPFEKNVLMKHFLADGIEERTPLLTFLPLFSRMLKKTMSWD